VTIEYADAKIAAHFRRAERAGARAAVIAGDDEIAQGRLELRDLAHRVQTPLREAPSPQQTAQQILDWYRALPAAPAELSA
jgi:histidyl-tRNA synthetase